MKQPELGKKILALRKQKGFTQEELVEQCNINVRTIQRIEAGDVSPRSYTIKAILDVLGFDYSEVLEEKYKSGKLDNILGINKDKLQKQLFTAFIFGIIYFIAGFLEIAVDFLAFKENWLFKVIYIFVKSLSFISLVFFFRGFVITAGFYKNYLLQISAFLVIVFSLFISTLDVLCLYLWEEFSGLVGFTKLITYGILSILVGVAIMRLKDFGNLTKWTGIFEIITGSCFLVILLAPIGAFTQAVVEIFEIILIYKIMSKIKNK